MDPLLRPYYMKQQGKIEGTEEREEEEEETGKGKQRKTQKNN